MQRRAPSMKAPSPIPAKPTGASGQALNGAEANPGIAPVMNQSQTVNNPGIKVPSLPTGTAKGGATPLASFKKGGVAKKTGPYKLHAGERVLPNHDILSGKVKPRKKIKVYSLTVASATKRAQKRGLATNHSQIEGRKYRHDRPATPYEHDIPKESKR